MDDLCFDACQWVSGIDGFCAGDCHYVSGMGDLCFDACQWVSGIDGLC